MSKPIEFIAAFKKGQKKLDHDDLNSIVEYLKVLRYHFTVAPPLQISQDQSGIRINLSLPDPFFFRCKNTGANPIPSGSPMIPDHASAATGLIGTEKVLALKKPDADGSPIVYYNPGSAAIAPNQEGGAIYTGAKPFVAHVDQAVDVCACVGIRSGQGTFCKGGFGFRVLAYYGQVDSYTYLAMIVQDSAPTLLKGMSAPSGDLITVRTVTEDNVTSGVDLTAHDTGDIS